MHQASVLPFAQQEILTDCAYDFYGLRLAACGLDSKIRLLRLNDNTGEWTLEEEWKAHDAPVAKISWAHPEHGPLIASCSYDRTVKIWEEDPARTLTAAQPSKWVERAVLTEAKGSVRCIEFAPSHFGLKLATISTDSFLRIYECLEIYKATSWQLIEELDMLTIAGDSPSPSLQAATPTPSTLNLEETSPPNANAPLRGGGSPVPPTLTRANGGSREADGGWCLTWCKDKWYGEILAVACGTTPSLKIIAFPPSQRPVVLASLPHRIPGPPAPEGEPVITPPPLAITSVSWAPSAGRSYLLVATASRDTYVRLWKIKPSTEYVQSGPDENKWEVTNIGEWDDHKAPVERIEFNTTGTILSSAGDDGKVRFWKAFGQVWRSVGAFNTHHAFEEGEPPRENEDDSMMD